jgi:hypothetical protein
VARFRRLCIDVEDDDRVIGASVEFFSGERRDREAVWVDGRADFGGRVSHEVLDDLISKGWIQPSFPFWEPPAEAF